MTALVQDLLGDSAARTPERVALLCRGQRYTYEWLERVANRLAHALRELGVARGDRVAICLENSVELVVGIFGALKAGAVFVVLGRSTRAERLLYLLKDSGSMVLVAGDHLWDSGLATRLLDEIPALNLALCAKAGPREYPGAERIRDFACMGRGLPSTPPECATIDLDLASLIYTSGTTGEPKGVMCDHGSMVFVAQTVAGFLENRAEDVILNVLPLSSSYGLYQLMCTLLTGGRLVLEQSFTFPAEILETIARERVTGFAGVPTIYSLLLRMDLSRFDLSSLRYLTNAGAGLPPAHVDHLRRALPGAELFLMHGLTEVARTMYLPPDQAAIRPGSSGLPMPGTELWIEDESGARLGPGQVGELVVRGRHVMRGYWNDPGLTDRRFRPGPIPGERVCYSGDLFRTDEEGYFYFVGRRDDIIKCRGEKVAPREVEDVLYGIRGVRDAAVIGVPDPLLGQAVKAFISAPGTNLSAAEVIACCRARLEDYMIPQSVEFRNELPKTESGKIRRVDLIRCAE